MADILDEVDVNVASGRPRAPKQPLRTQNRRKVRVLSPPLLSRPRQAITDPTDITLPDTPPAEPYGADDDAILPSLDDGDIAMGDPSPSSPTVAAADRKNQVKVKVKVENIEDAEEDEDNMEVARAVGGHTAAIGNINISGSRPPPKEIKKPVYPTPENSSPTRPTAVAVDPATWNDVTAKLNVLSSPAQPVAIGKLKLEDAVEEDGALHMFWTDYTDVNGSLCLFGKVQNKRTKAFVSAFIKVDNILRKLFFLPRKYRKREFPLPVGFA